MKNWFKRILSNQDTYEVKKPIYYISYNDELKQLQFKNISFNQLELELPAPFYKDYSHHKSEIARNYKSYDTLGFRDLLLQKLSAKFNQEVLKLLIITSTNNNPFYTSFAYLDNQSIVAIQFEYKDNFKQWMDIIFMDNYKKLKEDKENGIFERQPELNPNPQFMLILSKGQYSKRTVNSGMMFTEKPFENTGEYLFKNAPKLYQVESINAEKKQYIQPYIKTTEEPIDVEVLSNAFEQLLAEKSYLFTSPTDNTAIYETFEKQAGYPFPETLKAWFSLHNGINNSDFLSPTDLLNEWQSWVTIYESPDWSLEDLTSNYESDNSKTLAMYTNPYWIPFLYTGGGNFLAIDLAPNVNGRSGQIIAFGADEIKIRFIADDLVDFIKKFTLDEEIINNGF